MPAHCVEVAQQRDAVVPCHLPVQALVHLPEAILHQPLRPRQRLPVWLLNGSVARSREVRRRGGKPPAMKALGRREWREVVSPGGPPARCSHQTVLYKDTLFVFGGEYATAHQFHHYSDLWRLELRTLEWQRIEAPGGE